MSLLKKKKEKRGDRRVNIYQESYFRNLDNADPGTHECWFNNISLGGLAFDSHHSNLDKKWKLNILYKVGTSIRNDIVEVRYKQKLMTRWRYGCCFIEVDEERNSIIGEYITRKLQAR